MPKSPRTDPFWMGDPCAPLSAYTPVEERNLSGPCCPIPTDTTDIAIGDLELVIEESIMNQTNQLLSSLCEKNDQTLSALSELIELEGCDDFVDIC